MTDKLLEIDVRLLVLRHGRRNVLGALARLEDRPIEDLERELAAAEKKPKAKRAQPSAAEIAAAECQTRPEISEPLRSLAAAFEGRTFLPQLRDVQRFLERLGSPSRKLKSRAVAMPVLIRALAKLAPDELRRLAATDKSTGDSDFSLLARAIMGSPAKRDGSNG
jgi:hypothetical protein